MTLIEPVGTAIGLDRPRVDALEKVTGRAVYSADQPAERMAYAYLRTASVARGQIRGIDRRAAQAVSGVLAIMTHEDVGSQIKAGKVLMAGGYMSSSVAPLESARVQFAGQIVGVVVAESFEAAREAAGALAFDYLAEQPTADFDSPGATMVEPRALGETAIEAGDVERALAEAPVVIDARYSTPAQHQNPMELYQSTCAWDGEELTVWESSQNVRGFQHGLAEQLGIDPERVRFISTYVGGAFGARGELGQATALIALAAKRLGRPVKLVASRTQGFTLRTYRAETRHHVRLGADRDGRLTALSHDSWELTSRSDRFALAASTATGRLYACPNVRTKVSNVEADRQSPGFMRGPPGTPYLFALESALDELSYVLDIDPVELRRRNDTMVETVTHKPYTSRSLVQCLNAGAKAFGWASRNPKPASMRDGDDLVGWGVATAFYPAQVGPADCRITLTPELRAVIEVGTHEIGTGIRTIVAQVAADLLGIPMDRVEVRLGDSRLPAAPLSAGSNSTATVCSVVAVACRNLTDRIARAAVYGDGDLNGADAAQVVIREGRAEASGRSEPLTDLVVRAGGGRSLVEDATFTPHGIPPAGGPASMRRGLPVFRGGASLKDRMQFAFGAHFVEVRVRRGTGEIRVPRLVGAFAAGRIMNPRTARSQLMGGQIWGIASALHEQTEVDRRSAAYTNDDLADYLIAVNADITSVETLMLPEEDPLINPLGIKGVGEIGIIGVNAAVANAVYHATGIRARDLPIRLEHLVQQGLPA